MLWLIIGAMTLIALGLVLAPLLAGERPVPSPALHDLEVYRQQLDEIGAEVERGTLDFVQAIAARTEIERRMLQVADGPALLGPARARFNPRLTALLVFLTVPAVALPLYLHLGSPGLPSVPYAARSSDRGAVERGQIVAMVTKLADHLKAHPDDVRGFVLLGRSEVVLGDDDAAVVAYDKAVALAPDDADIAMADGEARVYAAKGDVTPAALAAFRRTLKLAPHHPGALYYLALARAQAGDLAGAFDQWRALYAASPPDAAWLPMLRDQIRRAAVALHRDPDQALPPQKGAAAAPAPGPTAAEIAAAKRLSPQQQSQMIAAMVGRLAQRLSADPGDFDGWMRLGQAYEVLGEHDKAVPAFAKAAALHPDDPVPLTREAMAMVTAAAPPASTSASAPASSQGDADGPVPAPALVLFRQVLTRDPGSVQALWYLGLGAAQAGDIAGATEHWQRLLQQLDPKSAGYEEVSRRLADLKK